MRWCSSETRLFDVWPASSTSTSSRCERMNRTSCASVLSKTSWKWSARSRTASVWASVAGPEKVAVGQPQVVEIGERGLELEGPRTARVAPLEEDARVHTVGVHEIGPDDLGPGEIVQRLACVVAVVEQLGVVDHRRDER